MKTTLHASAPAIGAQHTDIPRFWVVAGKMVTANNAAQAKRFAKSGHGLVGALSSLTARHATHDEIKKYGEEGSAREAAAARRRSEYEKAEALRAQAPAMQAELVQLREEYRDVCAACEKQGDVIMAFRGALYAHDALLRRIKLSDLPGNTVDNLTALNRAEALLADGERDTLTAAAPDLLAALQSIADHSVDGPRDEWVEAIAYSAVKDIARAAIAKTKGTT